MSVLTEKKLESKWSRVMNMSTSSTRPPSCMYCFGELSPMEGTPANMLFPSERDSASSRSRPPPRARFLGDERGWLFLDSACQTCTHSSSILSGIQSTCTTVRFAAADFNHNTAYFILGILDLVLQITSIIYWQSKLTSFVFLLINSLITQLLSPLQFTLSDFALTTTSHIALYL